MKIPHLKRRLEALEQAAPELVFVRQASDGSLTIDGKLVTMKEVERIASQPGKVVIRILREDVSDKDAT